MASLTKLTKDLVRGKTKSDVVREILQQTKDDVAAKDIVAELTRLTGEECAVSMVYNLRNEGRESLNGHAKVATSTQPKAMDAKPEPSPLSEAETYFKVRDFAKEIGGVEKVRAYLALVEKDEQRS